MEKTTVAIIGGGACGVAALAELMVQLKIADRHRDTQILLIEKRKEVGQGLAFGTDQPGHLLNTQADLMGIHSFEPDHFSRWLKKHRKDSSGEVKGGATLDDSYTTRRLYGEYIKEQALHYLQEAGKIGLDVTVLHEEAIDLIPKDARWRIHLATGPARIADHVILVPGTPKPNDFPEFEGLSSFFDFPWPSEPIVNGIPKDTEVCVLGSSLSAIDTIMTLTDSGHRGKIRLFSLDGLLPRVQPKEEAAYRRKFLTLSRVHRIRRTDWREPKVKELFRLFQQEAEHYQGGPIDWKATGRVGLPADQLLERDIRIALEGGDAFINILYDLRYESSQMWEWLSISEKQRFKQWLGPYWTVTRHAMPLVNAERLSGLFKSGRLEVNFPMHRVSYDGEREKFVLEYGNGQRHEGSYLINATGPATEVGKMKSTLMQNLLKSGVVEAYPVWGIRVDPDRMEVIGKHQSHGNLYAVGHICNGVLLDVNAVWFNVRCIATLCKHITKKLAHGGTD
ncbi:FAD/NAD(P)-binding protein [Algoriphagus sp. H41]|uniref:FAD/NAD(P)-binding protein n=1 Tax=Algoriphagus oliviformis TaxID=2811231 RepID=A0ABS3CA52_9BACT|nr:FAD/NAD(P)-binding protein [Algoriphagus oliviformis]MBN7813416.1 FAD/NAD(P)-binding protein [Algoriphagus oliviformis]